MIPEHGKVRASWLGSELALRTVTAVIFAFFMLLAVWRGGWIFWALITIMACIMLVEWQAMMTGDWGVKSMIPGILPGFPAVLGGGMAVELGFPVFALFVVFAAALASWLINRVFFAFLGVIYVSTLLLSLLLLRADSVYGFEAVLFLFLVVWATDTGAFFVGRLVGGPRIWIRVSPGKTWSGFGGGIFLAALIGVATSYATHLAPVGILLCLGVILSLAAQMGDFFESALKRYFSVKDSGFFLPGHGGMMDRFDGLVVAAFVSVLLGFVRGGVGTIGGGLLVW